MGNPFDKIKAETAQIRGTGYNNQSSGQISVENFKNQYASIYDEYYSTAGEIKQASVDAKAEMEKEVQETQDRLERQQLTQSWISLGSTLLSTIPSMLNTIAAAKAMKTGSATAGAGQTKLSQLETALTQAKSEYSTMNKNITDATNAKSGVEQTITAKKAEETKQQGVVDTASGNAQKVRQSVNDRSHAKISAADGQLRTAETNLSNAKALPDTIPDPNNPQNQIPNQEKTTKVQQAKEEVRLAEEAVKKAEAEAEAEAKGLEDTAEREKDKLNTIKEELSTAEAQKKEYSDKINDLTPKRDRLGNQIKQLEAEITRIKGDGTTEANDKDKK